MSWFYKREDRVKEAGWTSTMVFDVLIILGMCVAAAVASFVPYETFGSFEAQIGAYIGTLLVWWLVSTIIAYSLKQGDFNAVWKPNGFYALRDEVNSWSGNEVETEVNIFE